MIRLFNSLLLMFLVALVSCKKLEPRKPISRTTSSTNQTSIEINKKLYAAEEEEIEAIIDSLDQDFKRSSNGFYYRFIEQVNDDSSRPTFGDQVTFEYDMTTLSGKPVYTREELSPITKSMEQEYGIFKGMRETLKLMQAGDVIEVYYPSYTAYGYYGNQDRIGINVPFKSTVKLLGINIK